MTMIQGCNHSPRHCEPQGPSSSNPTHASTSMQGGQAVFENDNYRITAGDNNTITVNNKHTGECYQVWGDPHMNVDGKHAFDFWGTTSFKLEDGTKITIDTVPTSNNMTLASKMTITNGDYGVQVSGIDTNKAGDLKIDEAKGWGRMLDAVVSDGNTLQENPAGKGFLGIDDSGQIRAVDQTYINQTDLQKGGKPQPQETPAMDWIREAFDKLAGLVSIHLHGHCRPHHPHHDDDRRPHHRHTPCHSFRPDAWPKTFDGSRPHIWGGGIDRGLTTDPLSMSLARR